MNNESDGLRQAAFMGLDDDKTMDDVFAAIEAGMEEPAPWMVPYGGVSALLPGEHGAVSVIWKSRLKKGATYGIICFTPSSINQGQPHFMLGMVGQFTVQ